MKNVLNFLSQLLMMVTNSITPSCEIISQKISKSMDSNVSLYARLQIKVHIIGCKICRRFQKQLLAMNKAFQNYGRDENHDKQISLSYEARQRINKMLSDQNDD